MQCLQYPPNIVRLYDFRRKLAFIKVLVGNQAKHVPEVWDSSEICGRSILEYLWKSAPLLESVLIDKKNLYIVEQDFDVTSVNTRILQKTDKTRTK